VTRRRDGEGQAQRVFFQSRAKAGILSGHATFEIILSVRSTENYISPCAAQRMAFL
jgi:hypothetical protein